MNEKTINVLILVRKNHLLQLVALVFKERCEETNSLRVCEKLFQRDQGFTRFPAAFAGRLLQLDAKYFNKHHRKKAKQHNTYRVHATAFTYTTLS